MSSPRDTAASIIDDFRTDAAAFRRLEADAHRRCGIICSGNAPEIFLRGEVGDLTLTIRNQGTDNRLFLNHGVSGRISLGLGGSGSTVYLGRDTYLDEQHIGSRQDNDFIAVGNDVRSTGPGRWISGLYAGPFTPSLIIGDCCVISRDVVIRNSDGHPVMDRALQQQLNGPTAPVLIEPHVWLGERCAILKGVTIGAFARVALGAVVTREVPRHHTAAGVPASSTPNYADVWCWDDTPAGIERARKYLERYPLKQLEN